MALRQPKPKVVLSLTPLIDVVFILLVFFMLASEFSDWQQMSLTPQAALQTSNSQSDQRPAIILVRNDGSLELDGEVVATTDAILSDLSSRSVPDGILVKPEDEVIFQTVVDLVDAMTRAGLTNVKLAEVTGTS